MPDVRLYVCCKRSISPVGEAVMKRGENAIKGFGDGRLGSGSSGKAVQVG